jgi:hypothetical protein
MIMAELEDSTALMQTVCHFWKCAANDNLSAEMFEVMMYELSDRLGDDLICDELIFLSDVNYERLEGSNHV